MDALVDRIGERRYREACVWAWRTAAASGRRWHPLALRAHLARP